MLMQRRRGRPRLRRKIALTAKAHYFKPQGIPMADLEIVELSKEEVEVMHLKNLKNLDQKEVAEKMNTSAATVQRLLTSAYEKITTALVYGRAIKVIDE